MNRREINAFIAATAGATVVPSGLSARTNNHAWSASTNYPNNRAPLRPSRYVKLPLGAIRPSGWLLSQLKIQANGLTSHLDKVWSVVEKTAWKGDTGKNVSADIYAARMVPRWLEGLHALAGVLHDDRLRDLGKPYMEHALSVKDLASVTQNVSAWCFLGRFLPEYYDLTGDRRAIHLSRAILDYADSKRPDRSSRSPSPLVGFELQDRGMLLSFGIWYYNQTGEKDILALLDRCTKECVDDWANYFEHFAQDPKYFARFPDVTSQKSPDQPPSEYTRHGYETTQAVGYPVLYSLLGDQSKRESVVQGMAHLDKAYGQVGGRWAAHEWLANTDPVSGTELCDMVELLFSLQGNLAVMGDVQFADRIEQLIFNSFPGACTADMWAHQYLSQANQVLVSMARRPWDVDNDSSNLYGFSPNYPCCLSNMHSPWPRYVESMWMATADKGLVAMGYGPCRLKAKVAEGKLVEILQETDYPFSDRVRVTVHCDEPTTFPLHFRIPSWSNQAEIAIAGIPTPENPQSGTVLKIEREWKNGDVVTLNFNFKARTETRQNNAVAVAWGPLYFVLRIGQAFERLPSTGVTTAIQQEPTFVFGLRQVPTPPGCVDWRVAPVTDWNYALSIDRNAPQCEIIFNTISSMPFAQKGEPVRTPGSADYLPWQEDVPMILRVTARLVPQWGMNGANAGRVPASPVGPVQSPLRAAEKRIEPMSELMPERLIELIPYGCSRLRIAEFPTI